MFLSEIAYQVSQDDYDRFQQWKQACQKFDPNASFAGSIGVGAQAVNWIDPGNRVIGDWNGKQMSGVVYDRSGKVVKTIE